MPVAVICEFKKKDRYLSSITKQYTSTQIYFFSGAGPRGILFIFFCEIIIAVLIHLECIAKLSLFSHYVEVKLSKALKPLIGQSTLNPTVSWAES